MAVVVVDAENVRRSLWPNLSCQELVARARAWAAHEGHELRVVFDGAAPEHAPDLVGSPYADDAIVRLVDGLDGDVWVVTSDRGLRARVGGRVDRLLGGGSFARSLSAAVATVRRRVVVHGRVQGVGFRAAVARTRGVGGWVRNRADGTLEAVFEGDASAVGSLVDLCRRGPRAAEVVRVEVVDESPEGLKGFVAR